VRASCTATTVPDGLPGGAGAFACCSFWLVECLARGGAVLEARELLEQASSRCNDAGPFSEEVGPDSGELLGNFRRR
jgi:GH15 family glucan-1,4-alpha-glucosidase